MNSCTAQGADCLFRQLPVFYTFVSPSHVNLYICSYCKPPLAIITGDCVQRVGGRWQWQVWQTVAGRLYTPLGASLP